MRKLDILATKYSQTEKADKIFDELGWVKVIDRTVPVGRPTVERTSKTSTAIIDVEVIEIVYGGNNSGRT